MVLAVEELHRLGFVHRRLTPDCFWATEDMEQPFILSNHEYTTATTNQQSNFNITDSQYTIRARIGRQVTEGPTYMESRVSV